MKRVRVCSRVCVRSCVCVCVCGVCVRPLGFADEADEPCVLTSTAAAKAAGVQD